MRSGIACVLALACGSCAASIDRVGTDAAPDAAADAFVATLIDGGPDDPDWVLLDGLPTVSTYTCRVELANHPERLHVLDFEPCGDGCTRGVLASGWWWPTPLGAQSWASGGSVFARARFVTTTSPVAYLDAIVRDDGVVVLALRSWARAYSCEANWFAIGDGFAAFERGWVDHCDLASCAPLTPEESAIYVAPIDAISHVGPPVLRSRARELTLMDVSRGGFATWEVTDSFRTAAWAWIGEGRLFFSGSGALIRDFVLTVAYTDARPTIVAQHVGEPGPVFATWSRTLPCELASDGADVAWLALDPPSRVEVVHATREPADLSPYDVPLPAALQPWRCDLHVGNGWLALPERDEATDIVGVVVVSIASAEARRWIAPSGSVERSVLGLTEDALVIAERPTGAATRYALERIAIASLPAY